MIVVAVVVVVIRIACVIVDAAIVVVLVIVHMQIVGRCARCIDVGTLFKRSQILIDRLQFLLGSLIVLFVCTTIRLEQ